MANYYSHAFRLLGYQFTDGALEKTEQYLSRISGLQRLYSAIMTAKVRKSQAQAPHPHGLEHAWVWLSNILMLDPLPEVFPTLILRFIEICGPEMLTAYGKQFVKLILAVQAQYIPKLDQIDSGGPFSRLKVLIETMVNEGRIEPLKGMLSANFWWAGATIRRDVCYPRSFPSIHRYIKHKANTAWQWLDNVTFLVFRRNIYVIRGFIC